MIARTACALFAVLVPSLAAAQPFVRVVVRHAPPHLAGQQIPVDVQIYVPNFFTSPPRFPVINIPGATVTMPDESGVNLNEMIRGESYAGIQKTYMLMATTAGKYTLPSVAVTFRYAAEPGKPPLEASVALPPTSIEVVWPAGMSPSVDRRGMLVARVTIEQHTDRDPTTLRAGDALSRTVVTTVEGTQAMHIPPPEFAAPSGVRVYPRDPVLFDQRRDREGLVAGHRTDLAVYTFERPGTYVLPAIDVPWFDVRGNRDETARAGAITVRVGDAAANALIPPEAAPAEPAPATSGDRRRIAWLTGAGLLVVLLVRSAWRFVRRIPTRLLSLAGRVWAAIRRDRARHLPPLNPV